MKCHLCKNSTDFGKSHIIPESFFLSEGDATETPFMASNQAGNYPKRRPVGEYDSEILCKGCEKTFGAWDNYAKVLLLDEFDQLKIFKEGDEIIGYQRDTFDYLKLKLFFISVLWRASISKREYFKLVNLGPHEEIIREMILSGSPGNADDYSIQIFRFTGVDYGIPIIMPVHIRTKYDFRYNRIYLGSYFFDIKLSKRKTPEKYRLGELNQNDPIIIPCKNIKEMDEYRILKMVAKAPHNANAI